MPRVSVIVAAYNQGRYLARCLVSLAAQTLPAEEVEVIVVDDGSTDETAAVMEQRRGTIRSVHLGENHGLAAACNTGLMMASGELVVRVDADDWVSEEALELEVRALDASADASIALPDYWRVTGREQIRHAQEPDNVFTWIGWGGMMRTERVKAAGQYRPLYWEEDDLFVRMLEAGARAVRLPEALLYYRAHDQSMTASVQARLDGWRELLDVWPLETLQRWGHDQELELVAAGAGVNP